MTSAVGLLAALHYFLPIAPFFVPVVNACILCREKVIKDVPLREIGGDGSEWYVYVLERVI